MQEKLSHRQIYLPPLSQKIAIWNLKQNAKLTGELAEVWRLYLE